MVVAGVTSAVLLVRRSFATRDKLAQNRDDWSARGCDDGVSGSGCDTLASNRDALEHNRRLADRLTYGVSVPAITVGAAVAAVGLALFTKANRRRGGARSVATWRWSPSMGGLVVTGRF